MYIYISIYIYIVCKIAGLGQKNGWLSGREDVRIRIRVRWETKDKSLVWIYSYSGY